MSEPEYEIQDTHVPHEAEVAEAVDAQMRRTSAETHLADVAVLVAQTAITPVGSSSVGYIQGEANARVTAINFLITQCAATEANVISLDTKVNAILDILEDAELVPIDPQA